MKQKTILTVIIVSNTYYAINYVKTVPILLIPFQNQRLIKANRQWSSEHKLNLDILHAYATKTEENLKYL